MKYLKITGFLALLVFLFPQTASALEIAIEGNGTDSVQEVSVTNEQTTQVNQSNAANVQTEININANSGGNAANENGGNTEITTGDVTVTETVTNSTNNSAVDFDCCGAGEDSLTIQENGAGSTNTAVVDKANYVSVNVNQNAEVFNSTNIHANSGGNAANENGGNTTISTGDVFVDNATINRNINNADVYIGQGGANIHIKIEGNGEGSNNTIKYNQGNINWVNITNELFLNNNTTIDADSGSNQAKQNQGEVTITTGDVVVKTDIVNKDINTSKTRLDCCQDENGNDGDGDGDGDGPPPITPPGNGGNGGNGGGVSNGNNGGNGNGGNGGNGGQVLGMAMGQILPAAGTSWFLFMTMANIFTFLFGLYLRLRGGRSPSLSHVYA